MNWMFVWLGVLVFTVIVEASTMQLTSIWFAIGALCAWVISIFNGPVWLQMTAFAVVSVLTLIFTRPIALKYLKPKETRTNADAVPGKEGIVVAPVHPTEGIGQIKVEGAIWSAKPEDGVSEYEVGDRVQVVRIEGVKAVIRALPVTQFIQREEQ